MTNELLRNLPRVDDVLEYIAGGSPLQEPQPSTLAVIPRGVLVECIREVLDNCRKEIRQNSDAHLVKPCVCQFSNAKSTTVENAESGVPYTMYTHSIHCVSEAAMALAQLRLTPKLRPVINATGVVLHTNLGRASMAEAVAEHVKQVAMGYSTLEYDLTTGKRGSRTDGIENLLTGLTGAEAACIVNNNAAAVLLVLAALCSAGEVIVSRGELVEIGGSFRVPEVISQGGAVLREVGATNKTHLSDYRSAICENTAALLKVHTSNYKIMGFTQEVDVRDLTTLAREAGVISIYDIGSGSLVSFAGEPTVQQAVADGVDVLCFSGDKLLGGPQCGIVLGKQEHIKKLRKHPLYRALRADKLTLAALESSLTLYLDLENAKEQVPTLSMLLATPKALEEKAAHLLEQLSFVMHNSVLPLALQKTVGQAGGGSLPTQEFESWAVAISPTKDFTIGEIEAHLRNWKTPIIARIHKDILLLDVRTIEERYFCKIAECLQAFESTL